MKRIFLVFCLLNIIACEQAKEIGKSIPGKEHLDSTVGYAEKVYQESIKPGTDAAQKTTTEEIAKLSRFEYKVASFPADDAPLETEAKLEQLGQDRWECFSTERVFDELRVYCKRRPASYLRYIPRWLP